MKRFGLRQLRYGLLLYTLFDLFIGGYNGGFLLLTPLAGAQAALSQQFTVTVDPAPPAILNSQSFSNTTNTGVVVSSTGGTVAAGSYRIAITWLTSAATTTESNGSVDTAATAVITTTGATSTITIQPPNSSGAGSNVIGWRAWVSGNGGAAGAETAQVPTSANCTLAATVTIVGCSLNSPLVFTASTNFANGGGAPTTFGAFAPAIGQSAFTTFFENAQYQYHYVYWIVAGTTPGACTMNFQTGASIAALANVTGGNGGQTITCTSSGGFALPTNATYAYSAINLASFTPGSATTTLTVYYTALPFNPAGSFYWGNAAPTSTCIVGSMFNNMAGTQSITAYTCNAGTWTAITVP